MMQNIEQILSDITNLEMRTERTEQDILEEKKLEVKTTRPFPKKGRPTDIGFDLVAAEDAVIYGRPGGWAGLKRFFFSFFKRYPNFQPIKVNFDADFDTGVGGFIYSRSGLAYKNGVAVLNGPGVIEGSYRNLYQAILFNVSDEDYYVKKGDRVAQMIWIDYYQVDFTKVDKLSSSDRGEKGLGSSGK